MLLIVAHHYVVNSGLFDVLQEAPFNASSCVMLLFGAWGKTGINCFVIITCWFMCKSKITGEKLLKLYLQITFYAIVIYALFLFTGHEKFSAVTAVGKLFPVKSLSDGFVSCFLVFYLLIPFLNILVSNLDKKMHRYLALLLLTAYTILPTIPKFHFTFNYVSWFAVLYIMTSYIRFHGIGIKMSHKQWGWLTVLMILISSASVISLIAIYKMGYIGIQLFPYFFISDSNKILSLAVAFSSFMWFKDLRIPHSRLINAIGGATFGVLLIHANSDAMRQWLWHETVDCSGHFSGQLGETLLYAIVSVLLIFILCAGIDWFRGRLIEPKIIKIVTNLFG